MTRLATIIICLILSIVLGFFLLWPQYQKFSEERWNVKEKEVERSNQEEYFSHLNKLSEDLKGYEKELSKIDSALPSSPDIPELLNFLTTTSSQNDLVFKKIKSFSIVSSEKSEGATEGKPVKASKIKGISVDFEVSGSYSALKNLIAEIEKSARLIEVESISFSEAKEGPSSFSLKINTHSY